MSVYFVTSINRETNRRQDRSNLIVTVDGCLGKVSRRSGAQGLFVINFPISNICNKLPITTKIFNNY